jgi:hypothetical protein
LNFDLSLITTNALVLVPIVIAIVQAIKLTGWIKDHYTPLLSIGVGILVAFVGYNQAPNIGNILMSGAVYGLMASGLYSGVKTTMVAHARMKSERKAKNAQKN